MSYLDALNAINNANLNDYRPLYYRQRLIGLLWIQHIDLLQAHGIPLYPSPSTGHTAYTLDERKDCEALTQALAEGINTLHHIGYIDGWRQEQYALTDSWHNPPVALIERAAMPLFGGCGYGVHLNGITIRDGQEHLWIARRAADKPTEPNKLDQIAAGGMPYGITPHHNMQKEAAEEAAIPENLSMHISPVGSISYFHQVKNGIRADVIFNYDLYLPPDFTPHNTDGEVAEFLCLPIHEIMALVAQGEAFKSNANLVLIDYFIRHGHLTPTHPDYECLCSGLNPRYHALNQLQHSH